MPIVSTLILLGILLVDDISTVKTEVSDVSTSAEMRTGDTVDKRCGVNSRKRFACNDCEFTTNHSGHYKRHTTQRHHTGSEKPLASDHSETSSISASDLKKTDHSSITDAGPCPCCEEKFDTAAELERHLRDNHDVKEKILPCHSCNLRFVTSLNFALQECRSFFIN